VSGVTGLGRSNRRAADIADSLALLDVLHVRWVPLLETTTPGDFSREFIHPPRGPEPLDRHVALYAGQGIARRTSRACAHAWADRRPFMLLIVLLIVLYCLVAAGGKWQVVWPKAYAAADATLQ
jgi:hypothetical protein